MTDTFPTRRYSVAQGLHLTADVGGDPSRPGVILLHGGGQTRHSWGSAMRELVAQGFHVINLDARGHGDSDWSPDGDYTLATLACDLRTVAATLPSPPAFVGASMGGATSLYAVGNSETPIAQALVLVDIVPRVEPEGGKKIGAFMRANPQGFATVEEAADAVATYYPHRPRPKNVGGLMKNLRLREDGRLYWHWDPRIVERTDRPEPPQFLNQLLKACDGVRIPSLLVRGLQSDIVSDAGVEEFRQHLPQLEVFDVTGAGHMVAGDKNDAFNDGVIAFLRRHTTDC
ncbi:MAG: alpha/beta fold hydrolase [Panacagrimonas sp.]